MIVDDVIYFDEPMFQKGPVDIAVANAVDRRRSLLHVGRELERHRRRQQRRLVRGAGYRPAACPAAVIDVQRGYGDCHDFDTGGGVDTTDNIVVNPGGGFVNVFQWAQPWNNVGTDLDVFLLNSATGAIVAGSVGDQETGPSTAIPSEVYSWSNTTASPVTVQVVLARWSGARPEGQVPLRRVRRHHERPVQLVDRRRHRRPDGLGHSGTPDGFSVGAVRYDTRTTPETFSSRGPRTLYFGPADGTTPAAPLGAPEVVAVPHMAATDGGANTFFGSNVGGTWRFFGTSAAAPHAAAAAALMWERSFRARCHGRRR